MKKLLYVFILITGVTMQLSALDVGVDLGPLGGVGVGVGPGIGADVEVGPVGVGVGVGSPYYHRYYGGYYDPYYEEAVGVGPYYEDDDVYYY